MAAAAQSPTGMPEKDLYRIGEVSQITSTKTFVLRYWETEFPMLQPVKSPSGHRLYRREDIDSVNEIKRLLYDEGFTIVGARKHLGGGNGDSLYVPAHENGSNGSNGHVPVDDASGTVEFSSAGFHEHVVSPVVARTSAPRFVTKT